MRHAILPPHILLATLALLPAGAAAHAGHDHAPEAPAETVGEVPPRFYAQTDALEAVLVYSDTGGKTEPTVYLLSKETNRPVEEARVTAEFLSGGEGRIGVTPGETPGSYRLEGLGDVRTTLSLMLEIEKGDLLEIVSVDNVILPEESSAASGAASSGNGATDAAAMPLGIPSYLILGLLAMNALVGLVIVLACLLWAAGRRKHVRRRARRGAAERQKSEIAAALVLAALSLPVPRPAAAHAGEDHSGASLAASAALTSGPRHFVPVQTQIEGQIETTRVQERVLPRSFRALGRVEVRSDHRAVVTPPVEGRLLSVATGGAERRIPVVGESVRQGEILVVVEQILPAAEKVTLKTERDQVEADLRQAQQELALAAQNRERADRLAKVIAARELEEARARHAIATDRVKGLRSRLQTLNSALSGEGPSVRQIPVAAPISGTITESHATVGEYVGRDKALFTIVNLDEVFVGADVFESDLRALQGASKARITVEAFPDEAFEGTLHAISQEINPETRAVHVLFNVKNPEHKLRGGAFANVAIESDERRPVLVVPKSAVLSRDGVRHVLRKVSPEVFSADPVIVSEFREDVAVIEQGLRQGDRIAVTGLYQIRMSPALGRE